MSGPRACEVNGPHDVPDLRVALLESWRPGGAYDVATQAARQRWIARTGFKSAGRLESEWHRDNLRRALLWWVSDEMVDEISWVAEHLPPDVRPQDVPGLIADDEVQSGLVVLAKTLRGHDAADAEHLLRVDAFLYGPANLGPLSGASSQAAPRLMPTDHCVGIGTYSRVHFGERAEPNEGRIAHRDGTETHVTGAGLFNITADLWMPLGRSDWSLRAELQAPIDNQVTPEQHASMVEDRRWLAALHLVAADRRTSRVEDSEPKDRRKRAASRRAKLDPTVRVMYLRLPEPKPGGEHQGGTHASPKAHIVKSHPRWQACGPQLSERKLITVPRHWRGTGGDGEGPETVRAVVR